MVYSSSPLNNPSVKSSILSSTMPDAGSVSLETSKREALKAGAIKAGVFFGKALTTVITLGVVAPTMLVASILTGGWAWNQAMSLAFLPATSQDHSEIPEAVYRFENLLDQLKWNIRTQGNPLRKKIEVVDPRDSTKIEIRNLKIPMRKNQGQLDGIFIGEPGNKVPTVIYFCQNATRYEHQIAIAERYAIDHKCNIVMWNYPNVGLSTGPTPKSAEDLINSARDLLNYVTNPNDGLGVYEGNLILHGSSIGGALATQISKEYPQAHLRNERSFTKWSDAAQGLVNKYSFIGKLAQLIIRDSKWELDALQSWKNREEIPHKGFTWFETAKNDEILNIGSRIGLQIEQSSLENTHTVHTQYENVGHNSEISGNEIMEGEKAFIEKVKTKMKENLNENS